MKTKIIILFSLINILFLTGLYLGLLSPMFAENKNKMRSQRELTTTLTKDTQAIATLKQSLQNFNIHKNPGINPLTKTIIKLAKEQQLTIKQIEPLHADSNNTHQNGLAIQTNGSYQNTLKFIFYVNQLPFLLHWSNMTLLRVNNDVELTILLKMSKK